ncbi:MULTISPECIES: flagellar basal body L-ring protein FlgH [Acidobacteriaceae]|uniref:flagellar basal body L-ring protein FlgH n=1 Tax=Acidobacteriaceae TaxID=204434 RepID=UPI0020B157D0|nr:MULTISPECIES: flagellar basal body L-ring protein FlgH [Acidobacteriaceae]MDW5266496.1 flagellar basal body L-ring protein FlgH [Edaphobacter sp.]
MTDLMLIGWGMKTKDWPGVEFTPAVATPMPPRQPRKGGMGPFVAGMIGLLLLLMAACSLHAQVQAIKKALAPKPSVAETSLDSYLERVRTANSNVLPTPGSIWTDNGRLTRMNTDVRAMRPHDLISVVVEENLAASTDGTVKNSRTSNANSGISGLIGTLHAGNALQNLINMNAASGLNAQGTSATNSSLSTVFGGQVMAVLPNGILVIEAARQVEFSQQTQTIVLHGLVRPEDISQQNQVLSTAISSLELEVRGKGIVNDYTHRQNALVRLLQQILIF